MDFYPTTNYVFRALHKIKAVDSNPPNSEGAKMIQRYEETTMELVHDICRLYNCRAVFDADSRTVTYKPVVSIVPSKLGRV